jgi:hypothetical protein
MVQLLRSSSSHLGLLLGPDCPARCRVHERLRHSSRFIAIRPTMLGERPSLIDRKAWETLITPQPCARSLAFGFGVTEMLCGVFDCAARLVYSEVHSALHPELRVRHPVILAVGPTRSPTQPLSARHFLVSFLVCRCSLAVFGGRAVDCCARYLTSRSGLATAGPRLCGRTPL